MSRLLVFGVKSETEGTFARSVAHYRAKLGNPEFGAIEFGGDARFQSLGFVRDIGVHHGDVRRFLPDLFSHFVQNTADTLLPVSGYALEVHQTIRDCQNRLDIERGS